MPLIVIITAAKTVSRASVAASSPPDSISVTMSDTSMTREMSALVQAFGWDLEDLRWVTINAMKSAFAHFDQRLSIIDEVVKPGYAALSGADPA